MPATPAPLASHLLVPLLPLLAAVLVLGGVWLADVEYAAFTIAREALVNALMHARRSEVVVAPNGDEGELRLTVRDDGVGFEPASAAGPGHLGLVGMRERAQAVLARVRVQRRSGGGTTVSFDWQAPG